MENDGFVIRAVRSTRRRVPSRRRRFDDSHTSYMGSERDVETYRFDTRSERKARRRASCFGGSANCFVSFVTRCVVWLFKCLQWFWQKMNRTTNVSTSSTLPLRINTPTAEDAEQERHSVESPPTLSSPPGIRSFSTSLSPPSSSVSPTPLRATPRPLSRTVDLTTSNTSPPLSNPSWWTSERKWGIGGVAVGIGLATLWSSYTSTPTLHPPTSVLPPDSNPTPCPSLSLPPSPSSPPSTEVSLECAVCKDKPPIILFLPCRHLKTCSDCAPRCDRCPICRATIETRVHVYL